MIDLEGRVSAKYEGTGTTGPFTFPFKVWKTDQVGVRIKETEDSAERVLASSEYSVTLNEGNGGSVTLSAPLAVGGTLQIFSNVPYLQSVELENMGLFNPEDLEKAWDTNCVLIQQLKEQVDRAVLAPALGEETAQQFSDSLFEARNEAVDAQHAAETAQTAAETARDTAEDYRDEARGYAEDAETTLEQVNAAGADQIDAIEEAGGAQITAIGSAGSAAVESAKTSIQNEANTQISAVQAAGEEKKEEIETAGDSAVALAKAWAIQTGTAVEDGEFSAKYHAMAAETSASSSASSASASAASASEASVYAGNAAGSATGAKSSEDAAASSASAAAQSASSAATALGKAEDAQEAAEAARDASATSKAAAAQSEANAKTSETNAKTSETNAKTSEIEAAKSKTAAAGSASTASSAATTATQEAQTATDKAQEASGAASNAANSATNAASSATLAKSWATKTDGLVDNVDYSAKHYAAEAKSARTDAQSARDAAAQSATSAANSAESIGNAEENAEASASAAAQSASAALAAQAAAEKAAEDAKDAAGGVGDPIGREEVERDYLKRADAQTTYAAKTHTHTSAQISDLANTLSPYLKSETASATYATKEGLSEGLAGKSDTGHTHTSEDITDLSTALAPYQKTTEADGKYATQTEVTQGLNGKSSTDHTHSLTVSGDASGTATLGKTGATLSLTLANSGVTAGAYGPAANATLTFGGTFVIPYITVDAKGRVTVAANRTMTMPAEITWTSINGKPDTFTPSAHNHAIADVTGLQDALDGKQPAGSYAAATHNHTVSQITDLDSTLAPYMKTTAADAKYATQTSLSTGLAGKVSTTGNETINGTKTFASSPIVPTPTAGTHAANKVYVDDAMGNVQGCPTGMIAFFHATTPPDGWLLANGQNVSRTTYANLFAVIGTKYGAGDGSTTFTLPNLHHRFLEGTTTSSEVGQSVSAGLPNIRGSYGNIQMRESGSPSTVSGALYTVRNNKSSFGGSGGWSSPVMGIDASKSNGLYGDSSTVQPASVRFLPAIKF